MYIISSFVHPLLVAILQTNIILYSNFIDTADSLNLYLDSWRPLKTITRNSDDVRTIRS